jgi:aspartyl-tRNA(Asn)/glutamyl-tRNA(Gln) amidotransferase subunit A
MIPPFEQKPIHKSPQNMNNTDIAYLPAIELAKLIRSRKLSSLELTEIYLNRLYKYAQELRCVVTYSAEIARDQAREADADVARGHFRSLLHGVPYGIKDLFATKGIRTTWGSPLYGDRIIDEDAVVVTKLRDAGCPVLGKLAMIEFAGSVGYRYATSSISGACRTPWNTEYWSGGSSGGSAAATSAGLVGFSVGTETWGSILCPSAFCAATGFRPTSGRISRSGAMAISWTMDKIGPVARTVEDCATILAVISGDDGGLDPALRPAADAVFRHVPSPPHLKGLRVGVVRPDYGAGPNVQAETNLVFREALEQLEELGAVVQEMTLPDLPTDEAAQLIIQCEGASAFEAVARDDDRLSQLTDPEMRGALTANLELPAVDYIRALRIRALAQKTVAIVFARHDVLVAPSYLQVAPPVNANLDTYFVGSDRKLGGYGNMLGLPAISVPMGTGHLGLPLGLQIVGAPMQDARVVAVAGAYQAATPFSTSRPPRFV